MSERVPVGSEFLLAVKPLRRIMMLFGRTGNQRERRGCGAWRQMRAAMLDAWLVQHICSRKRSELKGFALGALTWVVDSMLYVELARRSHVYMVKRKVDIQLASSDVFTAPITLMSLYLCTIHTRPTSIGSQLCSHCPSSHAPHAQRTRRRAAAYDTPIALLPLAAFASLFDPCPAHCA